MPTHVMIFDLERSDEKGTGGTRQIVDRRVAPHGKCVARLMNVKRRQLRGGQGERKEPSYCRRNLAHIDYAEITIRRDAVTLDEER